MVEDVLNLTLVPVHMDGQGTTVAKVSFPTVIVFHYTVTFYETKGELAYS